MAKDLFTPQETYSDAIKPILKNSRRSNYGNQPNSYHSASQKRVKAKPDPAFSELLFKTLMTDNNAFTRQIKTEATLTMERESAYGSHYFTQNDILA